MKMKHFQDTKLNYRGNFAYDRGYKTGGFA